MKPIPCIPFKQGDFTLVVFAIPAKELFKIVSINRREEDKKVGYQRTLTPGRTSGIAQFIEQGNALPTNIVLALDKAKLSADKRHIEIQNVADAGWVIDGQHRLAGASEAKADIIVPVTAFLGLSVEEQIIQFITINREAKRVSTSLYLDLLPDLKLKNKSDADLSKERAVDLANAMRIDETSAFYNRIVSLKSPSKGQLSLTNFVRKAAPLLHRTTGILRTRTQKEQRAVIENYFGALGDVFSTDYAGTDSIFFKTVGFGALINAFPTVHDITLKRTNNSFTRKDVAETLKPLATFSFNGWKNRGTGGAAETAAGDQFIQALRSTHEDAMGQTTLNV